MSARFVIAWMYLIGFLRAMYVHLPIYTLFLLDHEISMSLIVFAAMFYSLGQFLFEVPTGIFADVFGQRLSLVIGFFIEALGLFLILIFPTPFGLCLSYLLGGIGGAFLSGTEEAILFENVAQTKRSYPAVYANYLNSQTIGMVAATIIGGGFFALFGISASMPLIFTTALALVFCALMATRLREPHRASADTKKEGSRYIRVLFEGFAIIRNDKLLKTIMIVSMLIIPGEYFLYSVYQPIFAESNVSGLWFGLAISVGMLLNVGLTALLGRLEKHLTLERILGLVTLLCGVFYFILSVSQTAFLVVCAVIGILALVEVYRPVVSDYVNERIPSERRVTVLSSISFAQRVSSSGLRLLLTGAIVLLGTRGGIAMNGFYLLFGGLISWWLLVRCGCTHRLHRHPVPLLPETKF